MEGLFFWLWVILIAIFQDHFWLITIAIIVSYLIFKFIPKIIGTILGRGAENKKYRQMLREYIPRVQNINLEPYQTRLFQLEKLYEMDCRPHKAILKNKKGNTINICPKCGGYMRIVRGWRGPFLGCSNYPNCRSTRNYSEIFGIKI